MKLPIVDLATIAPGTTADPRIAMLRRVRPLIRYGGALCIALGLAAGSARAGTVAAASQIELVIIAVADPDASGAPSVELRLLNSGSATETMALPSQIGAELAVNGRTSNITLERAPQMPVAVSVPAGGFTRARYTLHLPPHTAAGEAVLAVPGWSAQRVAFAVGGSVSASPPALADGGADPAIPRPDASVPQPHLATNDVAPGNAFLPNLSAYAPIYAVYGPGTNSDARLQISFKYQLFGPAASPDRRLSARACTRRDRSTMPKRPSTNALPLLVARSSISYRINGRQPRCRRWQSRRLRPLLNIADGSGWRARSSPLGPRPR